MPSTTHRGRPGAGPERLAARRRRRQRLLWPLGLAWVAGVCVLLVWMWSLEAGRSSAPVGILGENILGLLVVGVLVGAGGLVFLRLRYRRLEGGIHRALAGAETETLVAGSLRRLRAGAVAYNVAFRRSVDGRGGDIDLVVLGPWAIVVEIKRGSGRVRTRGDGRLIVGGRPLDGHALRQAVGNAAGLRRLLVRYAEVDVWVDPVVCIDGMRGRPRLLFVDGHAVSVCGPRHLSKVIRRLPRRMGRREGARTMDAVLGSNTSDASHRRRK